MDLQDLQDLQDNRRAQGCKGDRSRAPGPDY